MRGFAILVLAYGVLMLYRIDDRLAEIRDVLKVERVQNAAH